MRPGIIKLTHQVSDTDGVFLDVTVFKGEDFASSSILETKLYQKPMNKYVYLHYQSCHCKNLLKNFVQSEIKRYRLTCSRDVDFEEAKLAFRDRLVARSYPINILDEWMNLHYDRNSLFANRLANQKVKRLNKRSTKTCPLIFKIEHTKRTNKLNLKDCLALTEDALADIDFLPIFQNRPPVICLTRPKNLGEILVRAEFDTAQNEN
jgi:hypothetical protein